MEVSVRETPFGGEVLETREVSGLRLVDGVYSAKTKVSSHSHQRAVFCIALSGICKEVYAGASRTYEALTAGSSNIPLPLGTCSLISAEFVILR
jgi:hypothetical protein